MQTLKSLDRNPAIAILIAIAFLVGGGFLLHGGALVLGGFALFASGMNFSRAIYGTREQRT